MTLFPLDPIIFIAGPPILAAGATLWHVARRRRLKADAYAVLETIDRGERAWLDTIDPREIVEVRPHLYVVAPPQAVVIDARARFAARRAVAGGMGGGTAA